MPRFLPRLARLPCFRISRTRRQVVRNGKHGPPSCRTEFSIWPSSPYFCTAETTRFNLPVMGIEKRIIFEKPHWCVLGEKVDPKYGRTSQRARHYTPAYDLE